MVGDSTIPTIRLQLKKVNLSDFLEEICKG
jgi:hypothetical protein